MSLVSYFVRFESVIQPFNLTDDLKFDLLIDCLDGKEQKQVLNIIKIKKYYAGRIFRAVKKRLLKIYAGVKHLTTKCISVRRPTSVKTITSH